MLPVRTFNHSGKRVVYFLLVLIELFSLSVTAEALRAKIDHKDRRGSARVLPRFSRTTV